MSSTTSEAPLLITSSQSRLFLSVKLAIVALLSTVMLLSGCTNGLKTKAMNGVLMPDSARGVCAVGYDQPFRSTKGECFERDGIFEQTDHPETVIAKYEPPKRPPTPVVAPVAQPDAEPSAAKKIIEAAEARGEEQAPCYLTGSDEPFMMAKSICLSSGGKLRK